MQNLGLVDSVPLVQMDPELSMATQILAGHSSGLSQHSVGGGDGAGVGSGVGSSGSGQIFLYPPPGICMCVHGRITNRIVNRREETKKPFR